MTKWDWRKVVCVLMVLAVIGWVDDHLFPSAQAAIVLEVGSKGENVVKVQKRLIRIGPEGGKSELCGTHGHSSILAMSSSRNTSCSWVRGRLFCNS